MKPSSAKIISDVHIFFENGRWHDTVDLDFSKYNGKSTYIVSIFKELMKEQYPNQYYGMRAVCIDPIHSSSHPLMIKIH